MIPKVIHYCWFGRNPLPESAKKCIASWRKFFPDYEIKEWNEDNFDVNIIPYTTEAYQAKKYAFVSDYARFWILYHYGGIYFDTDVEVIKPMDDILARGPFMGIENRKPPINVAPGLGLGVEAYNPVYKMILEQFVNNLYRINQLQKGNVVYFATKIFKELGLKDENKLQIISEFTIYPSEYFNPYNYVNGVLDIKSETRSIHWYGGSWMSRFKRIKLFLGRIMRFYLWK
jgi:mannosyltransferase OCH1-like enzyme